MAFFIRAFLRMIINKFSEIFKKNILITIMVIAVAVVLGGLRIMYYIKSPDVLLLINRAGAHWIKYDYEFELEAKPASLTKCEFRYVFNAGRKIDNAGITLQALKSAQVFFDGKNIFSSENEFSKWKKVHDIKVPFTVESGTHEIIIVVKSENSYPAVIAYSETLPLKTGTGWLASNDSRNWCMAVSASQIKNPAISRALPSSMDALLTIWPCLAVIFGVVFFISFFDGRHKDKPRIFLYRKLEPSHVRWILLFLWALLAFNNILKLNFQVGSDIWGHIEYIDYIVTKGLLPLASDGWQMYQAPLNYILSAPLYALLMKWFDFPAVVKIMTIIPIICGLLQIEIVYRTARLVFAERKDLQIIAVITGSLLPMHTYICQYVGNEPIAACFISLIILLCVSLVMPSQKERQYRYFFVIGFVWGLALLSKMTAVLLAPVLVFVVIFHTNLVKKSLKSSLLPIITVFCVSALIAGWYYLINYIELGNPFGGTYEHSKMLQWWQDPSYRTFSQFLTFGQSLFYPVYSGVSSFWDNFYSTLWLDGLNSGIMDFMPWNKNFMIAGALLAVLPALFILAGVVSVWLNKNIFYKNAVVLSIGTVILFILAIMDIYMIRPIYSIKAGYTLGLLPCYSILVAAGAEPFLRNNVVRSFTLAFFACWAFAAYAAYFVINF
jgi:hypothetical protein